MLLVADDDWIRHDVEAALAEPTTRVLTVTNPRAVVTEAYEAGPDLYVVDMQVGSMGGMAVTRAIKDAVGQGILRAAPIVLLLDRSADVFLGRRAGADAWVQKPFTAQELRVAKDAATAEFAG